MTKRKSVQTVDRALAILEKVSRFDSISLNDLHIALDLNKPTLLRIIDTLCQNGYIHKDSKTSNYSLTLKTFEIGSNALHRLDYMSIIKSTLSEISTHIDSVVQFSIEQDNELLCIESVDKHSSLFSIYSRVGQRSPIYSTSAGKAILATYSNEEITDKWNSIDKVSCTKNTITDLELFLKEISLTRDRNYALDIEENELGVFCVGTVVFNHTHRPVGAISISSRDFNKEIEKELSALLIEYTSRLSNLLGHSSVR